MRLVFLSTIFFILTLGSEAKIEIKKIKNKNIELIKFQSPDSRYPGKDDIVAEIHFPKNMSGKLPVVIVQHGSNRDTMKFKKWGGKSDEFSKRIAQRGIQEGYAVAVIDSFYKKGISPGDKKKFPNAAMFLIKLKKILSEDPRFDKNRFFLTGFSFGAGNVNKFYDDRAQRKLKIPWKAMVAAEPACQTVSYPIKITTPNLIIKGDESHYPVKPCKYYAKIIKEQGNNIEFLIIPKVNHFFSFKGTIVKGIAVNGCPDNIAFRYPNGSWKFADGTPSTRREVNKRCLGDKAGSGKTREKLDLAVDYTYKFFNKHKN